MNRKYWNLFLVLVFAFTLAIPGLAFAAPGGNSTTNQGSTPNGKPFTYMNEQLQANADAIAQNAAAIGVIETEIISMNLSISGIQTVVQGNTDAIADLNQQVADLAAEMVLTQADLDSVSNYLLDLQTLHGEDMSFLQAQIDAQQALLYALRADLNAAQHFSIISLLT